ncbi:MAG: type II toxin-antitoxin system RelE/ParE family toxin [Bacteroidota bacterium]
MIFSLHVLPAALNDIQVSYDWYEAQSEDLGERYLEYIDKGFDDIIQNPFYQIRYSNIRCYPLEVFPFMVHYHINEEKKLIFVTAVLHTKRSEKLWNRKV